MSIPTALHEVKSIHKNRFFLRAFTAHIFSSLGDWLDFIAILALFTYIWKADVLLISILPVAYALPGILLSQAAGVWVDRMRTKHVLIYVDLLRSICTILLLYMPSPVWMLSAIFVRAAIGTFHLPAQQSFIRKVVDEAQLLKATGLIGTSFQFTKIIGPMLGSFVLALSSYKICLLLTAGCLMVSVLLLLFLPDKQEYYSGHAQGSQSKGFYAEWQDGWTAILSIRTLLFCLLFSFSITTVIQIVDIQLLVLLRDIKPNQIELPGFIIATIGIGAVCSTMIVTKQKRDLHYFILLSIGSILMGIAVFIFSIFHKSTPMLFLILTGGLCGIGTGLSFISVQFAMQKEAPSQIIGRVYGIYHSVFNLLLIVAPLLGGWLVKQYGAYAVFKICGFFAIAIGVGGILIQKRAKSRTLHQSKTGERNTSSPL